ncbi:MAG: polysaccharide biosynthesis/export family protein [Pirellulaceae bacterium]|nr:polysaccharide biosynthesis/export family protein [Pirellulaceae bacterium]
MITKLRVHILSLTLGIAVAGQMSVGQAQVNYPRLAFQQELGVKPPASADDRSSRLGQDSLLESDSATDLLQDQAQSAEELPAKAIKPSNGKSETGNGLEKDSGDSAKTNTKPKQAAGAMIAPSSMPTAQSWQLPIQYNRCNFSACNLPPQPEAPQGRCQPCIRAIDCANSPYPQRWCDALPYNFGPLAHGEHNGPVRLPSANDVRLRVNDKLRFIYAVTHSMQMNDYRLMVGDEVAIESVTDNSIKQGEMTLRGAQVQSDGFLYLKLVGAVRAEGLTILQLRSNLEQAYKDKIINPAIDVIPVRTNVKLTSILASVDNRGGVGGGGQSFSDFVHLDGTIRLPFIGSICVLGMTLDEVKREVNLRYAEEVVGLEVEPVIDQEANHFVFVYGEVNKPDRYQLQGPTSVTQALAMAGSIKLGGNMRSIVIFRRTEDWRLIATKIDVRGEHLGRTMTPCDEIWLRDNDLIVVPPTPVKVFNNFVKTVFTDGIYGIVPFSGFSITKFQQAGVN